MVVGVVDGSDVVLHHARDYLRFVPQGKDDGDEFFGFSVKVWCCCVGGAAEPLEGDGEGDEEVVETADDHVDGERDDGAEGPVVDTIACHAKDPNDPCEPGRCRAQHVSEWGGERETLSRETLRVWAGTGDGCERGLRGGGPHFRRPVDGIFDGFVDFAGRLGGLFRVEDIQ